MRAMDNSIVRRSKQAGYALLTYAIAALFLLGMLGSVVMGSRSSVVVSNDNVKAPADSVVSQAVSFVTAFQTMEARGSLPSNITYDNAATTGLLNSSAGGLSPQLPNAKVFASGATQQFWVYKGPNLKVKGVGVDANADYAFVLLGLDQTVCQEVNRLAIQTTTIPASTVASTAFVAGTTTAASPTDTTAVDMSGVAAVAGYMQACVSTTDSKYVFYVVVETQ